VQKHTGRFSIYIRPFSYVLDLIIINYLVSILFLNSLNGIYYHFFVSLSWIFISWNVRFYEVYRFTKVTDIFEKLVKQYIVFTIVNFAYVGYFLELSEPTLIIKFVSLALSLIALEKLFIYYFLIPLIPSLDGSLILSVPNDVTNYPHHKSNHNVFQYFHVKLFVLRYKFF